GDFADWAYGFFRIPAFTIELPPVDLVQGGFLNSESDIEPIFLENLPAVLYLIERTVASYPGTGTRPTPFLRKKLEKSQESMIKDRPGAAFKGKESR
ncbi:MAG: hypothetical protein HPY46_02245, partial [Candidatus Aminicenantes bacterium]|nr:hypothetical protein [Candidatus Aminicenantes bacterium]